MRAEDIALDALLLDPNNYRLQESENFSLTEHDRFSNEQIQERTLERLQRESLRDLIRSIKSNGFLAIERIVVTPYEHDAGKFLVIEGNRRVAALKLIQSEFTAGVDIRRDIIETFDRVPCIVADNEGEEFFKEMLMGIRHVGGIKAWGGYQRAKLIADLRDGHRLDASDVADRLGLSVQEVNRRYRAYKVLQQMQEDDAFGEFATPATYPIFHEAVSLPVVREWLGWNQNTNTFDNDDEREQFYGLITPVRGNDQEQERPAKISTYADVRDLRPVLVNDEARACLLDPTRSLIDAQTIARRDEISRQWKTEVSEAVTALKKVSALEIRALVADDVHLLNELVQVTNELLAIHRAIAVS